MNNSEQYWIFMSVGREILPNSRKNQSMDFLLIYILLHNVLKYSCFFFQISQKFSMVFVLEQLLFMEWRLSAAFSQTPTDLAIILWKSIRHLFNYQSAIVFKKINGFSIINEIETKTHYVFKSVKLINASYLKSGSSVI